MLCMPGEILAPAHHIMGAEPQEEDAPVVECTVVIRPDSMPKASLTTWSQREEKKLSGASVRPENK